MAPQCFCICLLLSLLKLFILCFLSHLFLDRKRFHIRPISSIRIFAILQSLLNHGCESKVCLLWWTEYCIVKNYCCSKRSLSYSCMSEVTESAEYQMMGFLQELRAEMCCEASFKCANHLTWQILSLECQTVFHSPKSRQRCKVAC